MSAGFLVVVMVSTILIVIIIATLIAQRDQGSDKHHNTAGEAGSLLVRLSAQCNAHPKPQAPARSRKNAFFQWVGGWRGGVQGALRAAGAGARTDAREGGVGHKSLAGPFFIVELPPPQDF